MKEFSKNYPRVSIITVCLNSKEYLEDAIRSVSEQTYQNIEYIIVDGDSTDGTSIIFDKYNKRIDKLLIEKDNGIFEAMNKGIRLAGGEIIYFLNADDKFYNCHVVTEVIQAFRKNKEADFIYGNIKVFNPKSRFSYIEKYPKRISKWLFVRKTIGHPATFFRSSCFEKAGNFDEAYKIAADYEWFLRALFTKGLKGSHIENNISIFKTGGISTNHEHKESYLLERSLIQSRYFNSLQILCARVLLSTKRLLCLKTKI